MTSRGNGQQDVVRDDADRLALVQRLARVVIARRWVLHSWVLMTNHLHLVVTTPLANLSEGMRDFLGAYGTRFNKVHGRVGHLFQHRFDAKPVEREMHLLELSRYVPLNPVRCGLASTPAEWPWSSYRATAGFEPVPPWLNVDWILAQFHPTDRAFAQREFRQFVSLARDVEYDPWSEAAGGWVLGSPRFCESVQQWIDSQTRSGEHPSRQARIVLPAFDTLVAAVRRELAVTDADLRRRSQRRGRSLLADLGRDECHVSFDTIAARLGTSYSGAAKLRGRGRELLITDPEYAALREKVRLWLRNSQLQT